MLKGARATVPLCVIVKGSTMETGPPDYYAILHIEPGATSKDVDRAYRKAARRHHPDLNPCPEAVDRMKLINEAYEVLSNPARRATYDLMSGRGIPNCSARSEYWRRYYRARGVAPAAKRTPELRWRLELAALLLLVILLGVELGFSYWTGAAIVIIVAGIVFLWR